MTKSALSLPLVLTLLAGAAFPAAAAVSNDGSGAPPSVARAPEGPKLAQMREVDVFYDRDGNEILLDPYTGEVLAIRPPQRVYREAPARQRRRDDGFYRDAEAALDRLRREREVEIGRREPPGRPVYREPNREAPVVIRPGAPDDDAPDYATPEDVIRDAPNYGAPDYATRDDQADDQADDRPQLAEREPVMRSPLAPPSDETTGTVGSGQPVEPFDPGSQPSVPQLGLSGASEEIAKIQVVLDRKGASPGVIDGRMGDNVNKAISAYREVTGAALRTYDKDTIARLLEETGGPAFMDYTITAVDAAGPYVASIPEDYGEKATLDRLGYTSVAEAIAERFHMDQNYLKSLNPGADFSKPGTIIRVINPGEPGTSKVARIVADKSEKQVRAYDAGGQLVAAYPATIGSSDNPSPSGTHQVERIALDPEYTYNPKLNFKQGENDKVLTIPPGPNGPVGTVWIALSKPTYGIHGTPDPSKIGKTNSHGCVRLTNWDAQDLAKRVDKGVTVEFVQ